MAEGEFVRIPDAPDLTEDWFNRLPATSIVEKIADDSTNKADTAFNSTLAKLGLIVEEAKYMSQTFENYFNLHNKDGNFGYNFTFTPPDNLLNLLTKQPDNPISDSDYEIKSMEATFTYTEDDYVSTLFDALNAKIQTLIAGEVSGLDALTEDAIFTREQERDAQTNQDVKDKLISDWAKKGWGLPGGGIFNLISQVDIEYQNKKLDKSRTIAEESRKLAIDNMKTGIQVGNTLEGIKRTYESGFWQRKIEAAKEIFQEGLAIFNASMDVLKTKANVYQTQIQAWSAEVSAISEGERVELESMKVQMQDAKNRADVALNDFQVGLKQLELEHGVGMEAIKTAASIAAHLCAAALSAVSATAHISSGYSQGISHSGTLSESHSYDETKSIPEGTTPE